MNMNSEQHQSLLKLLNDTFNPDGDIHFLAISEKQTSIQDQERPIHKIRVALTFTEDDSINPYFDGTDLFVMVTGTEIQFTLDEEWADGPPAVEGSPNEQALPWVSKLARPFYVSAEAISAANVTIENSVGYIPEKE